MKDSQLQSVINLLTPDHIRNVPNISVALDPLSSLVLSYANTKRMASLLEALLSAHPGPYLFEFVLANDAAPRKLDEAHRAISQCLVALDAVGRLTFTPPKESLPSFEDDEDEDFFFKKKVKQSHRKKKSKAVRIPVAPPVDPNAFRAVGDGFVPETPREASELVERLLSKQKHIFELYVDMLSDANVKVVVNKIYLGSDKQESAVISDEEFVEEGTSAYASGMAVSPKKAIPKAYPAIRPMRAAEYFEDQAKDLGEWPIIISTRTFKQIRQLDTGDAAIFEIVRKKIKELSQGFFSDSNQKKLAGNPNEVPIFEAKMTRDLRLVYQVDCGPFAPTYASDSAIKYERQMIRIYGIYTHAQFDDRLWTSVAYRSGRRGDEYRRRCVWREAPRVKTKGHNVTPPAVFPHLPSEPENLAASASDPTLGDADYLELHAILALEKFIPYSQTLLDKIRHSDKDTHEFFVSEREDEIIYHPSSSLVIGRSGTGKTTTMLFKMIAYERGAEADGVKVRQLFVTQSRVLAGRVKEYFQSLLETSRSPNQMSGSSASDAAAKKKLEDEKGLLELDDEYEQDTGLPARWSELEDHHFPLFVTFDQLCKLLEGDLELGFHREDLTSEQHKARQRYALKDVEDHELDLDDASSDPAIPDPSNPQSPKGPVFPMGAAKPKGLLTYDMFLSTIWRRFDQRSVKGLDPALVFGEFMGVIKGHELTLETPNGYLDRQTYEGLGERTQATFARARPRIYSLFESYLKQKLQLGCHDAPDRTHALLKGLANGLPGKQIDFLYVDEAQDNLIIDARLLRMLCHTPHGLCFCGDTAQTIALGSSFRFDDLKAFLWRLEEADPLVIGGKREPIHPKFFQLSINYRSHGGIVDAATCVVGIIMKLFPDSIDSLAPEQGLVAGPKPVFFHHWGEDVRYEQFLFGEANSRIEFGAEQVILVRNDAARDALRNQIGGEIGLILTLYESKGLEFSDVLLYNFFADSTANERDWRVVLNYLAEDKRGGIKCPELDETKHAAIQSELKFLYVGLTRARKHIWIWDSSKQADAMLRLWSSKNLINTCGPNDPMPQLAVSSSEADWSKSGRLLFSKRLFIQAKYCFEKANLPSEAAIAQAYQLRKEASDLPVHSLKRPSAYLNVANHFRACGEETTNTNDKIKLHRIAAECYLEAREHCEAAKSFLKAEDYTAATLNFRKGNDLDSSVDVIHRHKAEVNAKVVAKITKYAKVVYSREDRMDQAGKLFEDPDDHLEFLEDLGLDVARLKLLERLGRFDEAGEMCQSLGDERQAIRYFARSASSASQAKALRSLLVGLWKNFTFGSAAPDDNRDKEIDALLALAESLQDQDDEIEMFRAFRAPSGTSITQKLSKLGRRFVDKGNRGGALAALDRALRNPPPLQVASLDEVITALAGYQTYGQQIQSLSSLKDISGNLDVQKIFGFAGVVNLSEEGANVSSVEYRIPTISMLHREARDSRGCREDPADGSIIIPRTQLNNLIVQILYTRFEATLNRLHELALKAGALQPCMEWAVNGRCGRNACPKEHVAAKDMTPEVFNKRVRAFAQIIMAMDFVRPSGKYNHRENRQRIWLGMLFETLHPSSHHLGNFVNLNPASIPEYSVALPLLKSWVCERFYQINPFQTKQFVSAVLSTSFLAFSLDYEKACQYSARAPCANQNHPEFIRPQSRQSVVLDCLISFAGKQPASLSAGLYFIKHIVSASRIPVDLNVFVHFIERLTIYLVMNERNVRSAQIALSLNQLTLPKTWLIHGLARTYPLESPQKANILLDPVGQLMDALCFPPTDSTPLDNQYQFEGRSFSHISYFARSVFLSRLCRALVLLGYNSRSDGLKNRIHRIIRSLDRSDRPPHLLYQGYVSARTWDGLARTVRTSLENSPLDEMIRLISGPEKVLGSLPGIRNVFFNGKADLLEKIGFYSGPLPLISTLNPQVQAFVPRSMAGKAEAESPGEASFDKADEAEDNRGQIQAEDSDDSDEDDGAEEVREAFAIQRTEAEHQAARRIQLFVRRRQDRRVNLGLGGPFFDGCSNELARLGDSLAARRYRKYFIGPLPHVLTYLNRTTERCVAAKKQLSQKMKTETGDPLDALIDKVGVATQLRKDLIVLSKTLSPSSVLHKDCSADKLKDAVRKAERLKARADDLMSKGIAELDEDFELGMKGLVQEHRVRPVEVVERPALNTEDLDFD